MIKTIIFDFDGVIAESVQVKTNAFIDMYRPHGQDVVQKVFKHNIEHGGVSRFDKFKKYHKEFLGIDLAEQEVEDMAKKFSNLVVDKVISVPYVKGAYEFISKKYKAYDLFISSATPSDEILKIVKARGLLKFFKGVYGSPEKKYKHVQKIIKRNNCNKMDVIFMGDSLSDFHAASYNNINFIARIENQNENPFEGVKIKYSLEDLTSLNQLISSISLHNNEF